ncbi:flavodoxin domain-containing protein [Nocardiopsis sp. YSL2]|uniref:flavodoxin domain-containing protein n=1 Tax=Nocardiopsis sp. YSL2 TaxID=2939492 RepID=UPI0026F46D90|nr:flavodoxin domain-containing protein [Nocardiopsis sp. YSL2]
MRILVAYASKHGATAGIAERIGTGLARDGHAVDVRPVRAVSDVSEYDAFVVGSSVYFTHWNAAAKKFVLDNRDLLASRPVWLFSSGPVSAQRTDDGGDLRQASEPKELPELVDAIGPVGHRVFFGAVDPSGLTLAERAIRSLPAGRELLPEGDFRDWEDVDGMAVEIAGRLASDGGPEGRPPLR